MIDKGYFVTKNGIVYAENWFDNCAGDKDLFCEGLHVFSANRDTRSFGDGENISSMGSLFRCLLSENQYDIKKLAKQIDLCNLKDYLSEDYEGAELKDIPDGELTDAIESWSSDSDIPAFVFSDKSLFAEGFGTYCVPISVRNYSCAGDYFYDEMSSDCETEPDEVFWIDRKTFEEWGVKEEDRWDALEASRKAFEQWANGKVYGMTYRQWLEDKQCWTDEDSVGGFLGDEYYDLEKLLAEEFKEIRKADGLNDANEQTGFSAFNPDLNDGVLFERARAQKEFEKRQPLLFQSSGE